MPRATALQRQCSIGMFFVVCSEGDRLSTYRVIRGGSWNNNANNMRASNRNNNNPGNINNNLGFRCANTLSDLMARTSEFTDCEGVPMRVQTCLLALQAE